MVAFRPDKVAEYRQQAEKIRTLVEQVSLLEAKFHLFEVAQHLEGLAVPRSPKPYTFRHPIFAPDPLITLAEVMAAREASRAKPSHNLA
jgi:hypothetical protein